MSALFISVNIAAQKNPGARADAVVLADADGGLLGQAHVTVGPYREERTRPPPFAVSTQKVVLVFGVGYFYLGKLTFGPSPTI